DPRIRRRARHDQARPQSGDGSPPGAHQHPDRRSGGRDEREWHVTSTELVIRQTGEIATADSINAYLTAILNELPMQGEGDATGILAQIINAETVEDLDSPWQSAGMGKYIGYAIEITSIKRVESDFPGGLGWYLLCEGTVMETGEYRAFSTSAVAVMAQLLVAWHRGFFPYQVYVRIATKPTKKGFYPIHLELYRGGPLVDTGEEPTGP